MRGQGLVWKISAVCCSDPQRPPLLAYYSLKELYTLLRRSWIARPIGILGPGVTVPLKAGEDAFKLVQPSTGLQINEVLYFHDLSRDVVADFVSNEGQHYVYL